LALLCVYGFFAHMISRYLVGLCTTFLLSLCMGTLNGWGQEVLMSCVEDMMLWENGFLFVVIGKKSTLEVEC
jgi:hypothetical protein